MHSDLRELNLFPARRRVISQCLALGALAPFALGPQRAEAEQLRVGLPAPPASLVTLDGARVSSAELQGRVVILTFWATWCAPCREELPLLSAYSTANSQRGLSVLGFSLDGADNLTAVRKIATELSFPVGLLAHSSAPGYGRIWRLPVSFTIDRRGLLADDGWKDPHPVWTAERLERVVEPLLA